MKKTTSININGIFFHIDDSAYQSLEQYLEALRKHFSASEGADEIMEDIEARVAEIFQGRLDETKKIIQQEDVDEVIRLLGKPADISGNEAEATGTGAGPTERRTHRRLYRDPDHRVLGGVCSGLGHYFNADPIWFRLAFIILTLIFGTSILIYIAMWIVIPAAVNTSEKLEMKGESINIHTIERNIREEMNDLKNRYRRIRDKHRPQTEAEVRDFKRRMRHLRRELRHNRRIPVVESGSLGSRIGGVIENLVYYSIKALLIFVGIIFLIIGITFITGLILSLTGSEHAFTVTEWGMHTFSWPALSALIFETTRASWMAVTGVLLFIGVPVLMMIYGGVKLVLGYRKRIRIVSITATSLWLIGLLLCIYTGFGVAQSFDEKASDKTVLTITPPADSTLILQVPDPGMRIDDPEEFPGGLTLDNLSFVAEEGCTRGYGVPVLKFEPSAKNEYSVVITRSGRGSTMLTARDRAKAIHYEIVQQDSLLQISNYFSLPQNEKFRDQKVRITVNVPLGQKLIFDKSMENLLYYDDFSDDSWDEEMPGHTMVMTMTGLQYL